MDAFLPGVAGWEAVYNNPGIWHFRFNGPTPDALVRGRERIYFHYFWNDLAADKTHSIPEADRKAYAAAYSRPGRMHAGWAYFVSFQKAAQDFAQLSRVKLTMPVLSIGAQNHWERSWATDEVGCLQCNRYRHPQCGALDTRGTAQGNDGRFSEISVRGERNLMLGKLALMGLSIETNQSSTAASQLMRMSVHVAIGILRRGIVSPIGNMRGAWFRILDWGMRLRCQG